LLPIGHPQNPHDKPIVSTGFHRSQPLLADEVNQQHAAGLPFTDEQRDWLLTEAIINWGGPLVESMISDFDDVNASAAGDFQAFARVAGMLGQTAGQGEGATVAPAFQAAATEAAKTILRDLMANVVELARLLTLLTGAWPEATILRRSGLSEEEIPAALARRTAEDDLSTMDSDNEGSR